MLLAFTCAERFCYTSLRRFGCALRMAGALRVCIVGPCTRGLLVAQSPRPIGRVETRRNPVSYTHLEENPSEPKYLLTVQRVGYKMTDAL